MSQTSRYNSQNPEQCSTKGVKPRCPNPCFTTPQNPRAMQHQRGQASISQTRQDTQNPKQCSTKGVKPRHPKPDMTPKTQSNAAPKGSSLDVPNYASQRPNPQSNATPKGTSLDIPNQST